MSLSEFGSLRQRLLSFSRGLALGFSLNIVVIMGIVYLTVRDTSLNPWETLTFGALGAVVCISPLQLAVAGALATIRRIRWLSLGLGAATVVGAVALIVLMLWSDGQATIYARVHHLA